MKLDRERLQRLLRPRPARRTEAPPQPFLPGERSSDTTIQPVMQLVGGRLCSSEHGDYLIVERRYPLDTRRGPVRLGDLLRLPGDTAAWLSARPTFEQIDFSSAAFIDTETTGLSGGVGTLVFLVGIGRFEDGHFVVRQFFLHRPDAEQALLRAVQEALVGSQAIVTFNGRAFDIPLLSTRFRLAWMEWPITEVPHFDLLTAARRLWRRRLGSCTLTHLEQTILGFARSEQDVPGWLVPTLYQQYIREGTAAPIARIFYHNREDVVSMVALAATLCQACSAMEGQPALHPVDYFSVGLVLEQAGHWHRAEEAYRRALASRLPDDIRSATLARLGALLKRQGRHQEASAIWEMWADDAPESEITPLVELAKHCEWRTRDIAAALSWSEQARRAVEAWPPGPKRARALAELDHRIRRLRRKLGRG